MRRHTIQDIEYDLNLLWKVEGEGVTQAALASEIGMSEGHLSRRLARARRFRAHREAVARLIEDGLDGDDMDRFDYPYMELVGAPVEDAGNEWATIEGSEASRDHGTYHVGGRVKSLTGGVITTEDTSRTDGKPQPTEYHPDPRLKGGKGR